MAAAKSDPRMAHRLHEQCLFELFLSVSGTPYELSFFLYVRALLLEELDMHDHTDASPIAAETALKARLVL